MKRAQPQGQTRTPTTARITRCHDAAEHELLLADLERDALVDADIAALIWVARRMLTAKGAPTPWWAS